MVFLCHLCPHKLALFFVSMSCFFCFGWSVAYDVVVVIDYENGKEHSYDGWSASYGPPVTACSESEEMALVPITAPELCYASEMVGGGAAFTSPTAIPIEDLVVNCKMVHLLVTPEHTIDCTFVDMTRGSQALNSSGLLILSTDFSIASFRALTQKQRSGEWFVIPTVIVMSPYARMDLPATAVYLQTPSGSTSWLQMGLYIMGGALAIVAIGAIVFFTRPMWLKSRLRARRLIFDSESAEEESKLSMCPMNPLNNSGILNTSVNTSVNTTTSSNINNSPAAATPNLNLNNNSNNNNNNNNNSNSISISIPTPLPAVSSTPLSATAAVTTTFTSPTNPTPTGTFNSGLPPLPTTTATTAAASSTSSTPSSARKPSPVLSSLFRRGPNTYLEFSDLNSGEIPSAIPGLLNQPTSTSSSTMEFDLGSPAIPASATAQYRRTLSEASSSSSAAAALDDFSTPLQQQQQQQQQSSLIESSPLLQSIMTHFPRTGSGSISTRSRSSSTSSLGKELAAFADDMTQIILMTADPGVLVRCMCVCRQWYRASSCADLWSRAGMRAVGRPTLAQWAALSACVPPFMPCSGIGIKASKSGNKPLSVQSSPQMNKTPKNSPLLRPMRTVMNTCCVFAAEPGSPGFEIPLWWLQRLLVWRQKWSFPIGKIRGHVLRAGYLDRGVEAGMFPNSELVDFTLTGSKDAAFANEVVASGSWEGAIMFWRLLAGGSKPPWWNSFASRITLEEPEPLKFEVIVRPDTHGTLGLTPYSVTVAQGRSTWRSNFAFAPSGGLPLVSVDNHGPAAKAGVRIWDVILAIEGEDTISLNSAEVTSLIRKAVTDHGEVKISLLRRSAHHDRITCISVAGNLVAVGSVDGVVSVWDSDTNKQIAISGSHRSVVTALTWGSPWCCGKSRIGCKCAAAAAATSTNTNTTSAITNGANGVWVLSGSSDGNVCAMLLNLDGEEDPKHHVWNSPFLSHSTAGHNAAIREACSWGCNAVTCADDAVFCVWNIEPPLSDPIVMSSPITTASNLNTNFAATAPRNAFLQLTHKLTWNVPNFSAMVAAAAAATLGAHGAGAHAAASAAAGQKGLEGRSCVFWNHAIALVGTATGPICVWDIENATRMRLLEGHTGAVMSMALEGTTLVSGSADGTIRLWTGSAATGPDFCEIVMTGHEAGSPILSVAISGEIIVSGSADKTVRVWDRHGICFQVLEGHSQAVRLVTLGPSRCLMSKMWDGGICIWKFEN